MQDTVQKLSQICIIFEKPSILCETLKTLTNSNYPTVQYFLLKLRTCFLLTNVYKRVCGVFLFCLDLQICKNLNKPGFYTLVFKTFTHNSRSKQSYKNPTHHFIDITKQKTCPKFQQKILNTMVAGVFNFSDKKPGFLEMIQVCLNVGIGFCITWLLLPNYKKNQSVKTSFELTTRATLKYLKIVS